MFMLVLSLLSIFVAQQGKVTGVRSPERPVVPNVTALSATEMRITWCRVNSNKIEIDHYELYIDTQLEYSGIDVMYVAKRLKPWSWYEVKLRACGFSPGSCSPFSRLALVKTLRDGDNTTAVIHSGVTIFKVIVVPTYMFILGMIAGVLAISLVFIWRYIQCTDLSGTSAFELPQCMTTVDKGIYSNIALALETPPAIGKDPLMDSHVNETESQYLEIVPSKVEILSQQNHLVFADFLSPSMYTIHSVCDETKGVHPEDQVAFQMPTGQIETPCIKLTHTQPENLSDGESPLNNYDRREHEPGLQNGTVKDVIQLYKRNVNLSNSTQTNDARRSIDQSHSAYSVETEDAANKGIDFSHNSSIRYGEMPDSQLHFSCQEISTDLKDHSSSFCQDRLIVAIDNSNIYIGAQECASMVNAGDRKRHVRVKLQNLVRILEKERTKIRGFACGSSPPATEHVWDVYRRLGYVVDLEDRRGKDEQRVDEGLHLWIYKALCELSPGVLVLATGDGMKGKSECDTSFPRCAMTALERGWTVEVYSWKHSLSSEWIKLAIRHHDNLTIHYLDNYVNYITFVDGKNGRKCSPLPSETSVL